MGLADILTPILIMIVPPFSSKQCLAQTFQIVGRMLGPAAIDEAADTSMDNKECKSGPRSALLATMSQPK